MGRRRGHIAQLCAIAKRRPGGDEWLSEIKFDGYRILAALDGGKVPLLTRNGHDWAERMPFLARAVAQLPVRSAMVDGELVSLRQDGIFSFPGLQTALKTGRDDTLMFQAFDLLQLDGWDLRPCSLLERKRVLPLVPNVGWNVVKPFCRAFAETIAQEESRRFLAHLKNADRRGRILVDWLRNGLGATAVASFSPVPAWSPLLRHP